MLKIKGDKHILWGSATAAYQCEGAWDEGGKGPSIWDEFVHSDKNNKGITADFSCDFYHHYAEDIALLAEGGQTTFRFSISWSRIFPKDDGVVNQEGVDFYNRVLDECEKHGLVPNVTLLHYDLPDYIGARGWENRETTDKFADYCRTCFELFGDRIPYYVTINEPNHNSACGYLSGNYPPNRVGDLQNLSLVCYHNMVGNAKAVREFRRLGLTSKIGIVSSGAARADVRFQTPEYLEAKRIANMMFHGWLIGAAVKGEFPEEIFGILEGLGVNLDFVRDDDLRLIKDNTVDFIGDNVYARKLVKPYESGENGMTVNNDPHNCSQLEGVTLKGLFQPDVDPTTRKNPWGREIYPKCGYDALIRLRDEYDNVPVFITENGHGMFESPDEEGFVDDQDRIDYLEEYLDYFVRAINEGCNVQGYYVWSAMDLYSWINGYEKRYGLIHVDYDNDCRRTPKKSFWWYRDYIAFQSGHATEGA